MASETPMPDRPEAAPRLSSLERVAIRTRESGVTLAGWRLSASTPTGPGAITRVAGAAGDWYRGEGAFLGAPQSQLSAEYERLRPSPGDPLPDPGQFG